MGIPPLILDNWCRKFFFLHDYFMQSQSLCQRRILKTSATRCSQKSLKAWWTPLLRPISGSIVAVNLQHTKRARYRNSTARAPSSSILLQARSVPLGGWSAAMFVRWLGSLNCKIEDQGTIIRLLRTRSMAATMISSGSYVDYYYN